MFPAMKNTPSLQAHRNRIEIADAIRGAILAVTLLASSMGASMMAKAGMPREKPSTTDDARWKPSNWHIYRGMDVQSWEELHKPPQYWKYHFQTLIASNNNEQPTA